MRREYHNVVAALAQLAAVPTETIEALTDSAEIHGLVIACRAARLNWNTTAAIINNRKAALTISQQELELARERFEAMPLSNAQRTVRFGSFNDLTAAPSVALRRP